MQRAIRTFIITAIAFTVSAAAFAADLTEAIKRDVQRGQNAALFAIKPWESPSIAMRVFMAEDKKHEKASDAFKLDFAQGVCSHMATAYKFRLRLSLPRKQLQEASTG
jgi:hypothetical protein